MALPSKAGAVGVPGLQTGSGRWGVHAEGLLMRTQLFVNGPATQACKPGWVSFSFFECPPDWAVARLASSGSEGSAAGGRETMSPIVLPNPSPEGTWMGPHSLGLWMGTWCTRGPADVCRDLVCSAVPHPSEAVKSPNPYRKYPQRSGGQQFSSSWFKQ